MTVNFSLILSFFGIFSIYLFILYFISPKKTISIKDLITSVIGGILSVSILKFLQHIVPPHGIDGDFILHMYSVGPREEISKFLLFWLVAWWVGRKRKIKPVEYMILSTAVGLGFALEENLHYFSIYGERVLSMRNVSSMPAHMFFGAISGYWFALGKINDGEFGERINLGQWFKKSRLAIYTTIGLFCASLLHGIWNYTLSFYSKVLNLIMKAQPDCSDILTFTSPWMPLTLFTIFVMIHFSRLLYRDLLKLEVEQKNY